MIDRFGNLQSFVPEGPALVEGPELGMAYSEPPTGLHGRQEDLPEALVTPRSIEKCDGLPEAANRSPILTLFSIDSAEVQVHQRLRDDIFAGRGEREGALAAAMAWSCLPIRRKWFDRKREIRPS